MNDKTEKSKPKTKRNRRMVIAVVVVACAIVAGMLWPRTDVRHDLLAKPASTSMLAQSTITPPGHAEARTTAPLPRSREASSDEMWEKVAALLKGPRIKVCGLSDMEAALFVAANRGEDVTAGNAALATATGKLVQSDSVRERALGLYVQVYLAESAAIEAFSRSCQDGANCRVEGWRPQPQVRAAVAEPLVKLAMAGRDPDMYAAAAYVCNGVHTGACASIHYANWAKIEPDNAAAWLLVAAEALSRQDVAAHTEAIQRLATAKRYDPRVPSLAPVFDAEAIKTQPSWMQSSVGQSLLGLHASSLLLPYGAIGGYCVRAETLDHARRTTCDMLANKLLETDESLFDLAMATAIGKKIGWDPARLQALADKRTVTEGLMGDWADDKEKYGCETLTKNIQWIRNSLSKGEMSIIRELIAKSGKTIPELAEKYRAAQQVSNK